MQRYKIHPNIVLIKKAIFDLTFILLNYLQKATNLHKYLQSTDKAFLCVYVCVLTNTVEYNTRNSS